MLTQQLLLKIRAQVLEGKTYISIQANLGVKPDTWDRWVYDNYQDFRTNLNNWKHERMLKQAEGFSDELMDMSHHLAHKVLAIKQKEAEFLRETLGKTIGYTKRNELTGADGASLIPVDDGKKKNTDKAINEFLGTPKNPR